MMRRLAVLFTMFLTASIALGQENAIPTPDAFLGYTLGDRFTPYARILDYYDELARRSDLVTVQRFGETYEHRPLVLVVITSKKNRSALETIRKDVVSLSDPEHTTPARAQEIASATPAIAWLGFGIHGNESSSAEASMQVASALVRDPSSSTILENLVVLIDPLQNPDGRERYVQWFTRSSGAVRNSNPESFEHSEPWPGGRTNHYMIDMNRDWAWTSQQESIARVVEYRKWNPQVFVDFHEMGYGSSYFFPPDSHPINANLPKEVEGWLDKFGRANAEAFTSRGWPFFVAERFDLFYPGYGDSWPSLHGAIGMTYEVAGGGRAGSSVLRDDGANFTLADRIARHFTTGMATLRTASENRQGLLLYSFNALHGQMSAAPTTYFILPGSPNFRPLVVMLQRQSIRIDRLTAPATLHATRLDAEGAESRIAPPGTAVISTRQPLGGLVQTLLERSPAFTKGFVEEQQKKTHADEPDDFYDLTSWSLPLAMNVEAYAASAAPANLSIEPFSVATAAPVRKARYAYLVDGHDANVYRVAGRMLRDSVRFSVSDDSLVLGDRTFARGTLVILKGNNSAELDGKLENLSRDTGAMILPVDSGWTGTASFGSEKIHFVKTPKIALVGGSGTSSGSFGMLWHTLDIDTPIPHSNLTLESLKNVDLLHYDVLVLPDGDYEGRFGKNADRLKAWLRNGGTLVAIRGANAFLREKDTEISKIKLWEPPKKKDDDKTVTPELYNDFRVPGATFRTVMNERSYLTFGIPRSPNVLIEGSLALLPVSHAVDNVVTITKEKPLIAGVAWNESVDRLKGAAYLVSEPFGKGQVITFADEPHFRLFWRGTLPLFLNAVLYSPSFPRD